MENEVDCGIRNVPGVPVGTKLVRIGRADPTDWVIWKNGPAKAEELRQAYGDCWQSGDFCAIIVPDNVYDVIDLVKVPVAKGWHLNPTAAGFWFRHSALNEYFIEPRTNAVVLTSEYSFAAGNDTRRIIVERDKPETKRVLVIEIALPPNKTESDSIKQTRRILNDWFHWPHTEYSSRIEERPVSGYGFGCKHLGEFRGSTCSQCGEAI